MEIQVGEYVRVMGGIAKLVKKEDKGNKKTYYFDRIVLDGFNFLSQYGIDQLVRKHSFEIIDLIEKGDFVNRLKIIDINGFCNDKKTKAFTIYKNKGKAIITFLKNEDIKSIVTKEQFKSMEYEVK